jgi:hypothetical protein
MSDRGNNTFEGVPPTGGYGATRAKAKAAACKAARAAWNAGSPFPIASDLSLFSEAIAAACAAPSPLEAAQGFAKGGVPVFPVNSGDKRPLSEHGVYSATTDLERIARWWRRKPDALIAVPMGRRTGVFAIDVDAKPPHAHDGIGAWRALEAEHGPAPTRTHLTASGGQHLIYRWRADRPIACPMKGLPEGIECKGEGGAIVFPPSQRGGKPYIVVSDVVPADPPQWLVDILSPPKPKVEARPRKDASQDDRRDGLGSAYGLKALENARMALTNAGRGERDRTVGENALAIGSLAAGGELDERHALQTLKHAGQSNPGSDAHYCDKIERAFETGKENPRSAPPGRSTPKRAAKQRSNPAETPKRDIGNSAADGSCPSCPSYPHVLDQPGAEKKSQAIYDGLAKRIGDLDLADEAGARVILDEAVKNSLSEFQIETIIKLLNKVGFAIKPLRRLLGGMRAEAAEARKPSAEERERLQREDDERRKREANEERETLRRSCSQIAESPTLLADMEEVVHRVGVVGEGAAIRGAYLAGSSRLLRKRAICLLRRGAAAGGKNFLLSTVFRLVPNDSVVVLSSGSPMSLVYYGGGDEGALKHKVLYVQEAAILAEKNGVESPLTVLLRLLISEGQIDHLIAVPKPGDTPVTLKIKRNGPVAVCITSARDNIESEMLTRLLTSDADGCPDQTMAVVKGLLSNDDSDEEGPELASWLNFQRLLELEGPYDVSVPIGVALYRAYERRLQNFPHALQLRMRRDISGLISAIKTSAVLHKFQRDRDARGRIVATIDDYRHAHEAFDEGVSSLYGVKTRKEIIAVIRAVEDLGATLAESVKVTVAALRKKLGINSNSTANDRLMEAVECGALEVDDEASGAGKGRPRHFKLLKTSTQIAAAPRQGVFPPPEDVLAEINNHSHVASGHADKTDRKDKTDETDDRYQKLVEGGGSTDAAARPFRRDVKPECGP